MPDIIHRIGIRAPAARVLDAITTATGIAGWWTRDASDLGAGRRAVAVRFRRHDGTLLGGMEYDIAVESPDRRVRWRFTDGPPEWLGTDATFELTEDGDMTILVFGHRGWREPVEFMAHCSMKWAVFLLSLRDFAESGAGRPSPVDMKIDNWN